MIVTNVTEMNLFYAVVEIAPFAFAKDFIQPYLSIQLQQLIWTTGVIVRIQVKVELVLALIPNMMMIALVVYLRVRWTKMSMRARWMEMSMMTMKRSHMTIMWMTLTIMTIFTKTTLKTTKNIKKLVMVQMVILEFLIWVLKLKSQTTCTMTMECFFWLLEPKIRWWV